MRGDGFSNVGRNYSPAWGGQFQEGGEIPMAQKGKKVKPVYVESKNDPRYKAYQDSLNLSDFSKFQNKTEPKIKGLLSKDKSDAYAKTNNHKILKAKAEKIIKNNKNIEYINPDISIDIRHKLNSPTYEGIFGNGFDDKFEPISSWKGVGFNYNYAEPKQKVIVGKKPQQEVKVKPTTTTIQTTKRFVPAQNWVDPITGISYTEKPFEQPVPQKRQPVKALQNNLKPKGLIQSDIEFNADMSGLRPQVRQPKYYNIQENINQPFGGSQTNYRTSDLNSITSPDDLGPGNTRNITPVYQTGGSLPGSVGFTYARTKGIPSNGPYAKKTLASAQNGTDMYNSPIIAKENYIKGKGRSNYDPRTNISNLYDLDPRYNHTRAHENYHARQFAEGRSNFDIGHNTENALWAAMQKKPEITSTEEVFDNYHNRKRIEMEMDRPNMVNIVPETRFMPSRLIDKYTDRNGLQYRNPNSMEGEAEYYGDLGEEYYKIPKGQNGMEMKYYQNGLDFKPKSISRDGAWLDQYDVAQNGKKQFKLKDERLQAIRPSESTFVKKPNFEAEQAKVRRTYVDQVGKQMAEEKRRKKLTKDQREREDYNARNEQTGSIQAPVEESTWDRTKAIVSNPLTTFGYAARNESLPTRFQFGERNTLDNAIDWVNPLQGAAALSEIPGELGRGELLNAGLSALDAADLGVYFKGAKQLRNINPEGKVFNGLNNQLDDIAIKNTERYMTKRTPSNTPLSKEMNPQLLDNFDPGEYTPFQEDDYMKWFNAQKDKLNPRPVKQDPRSILRRKSIIDINDMKEVGVIKDDMGYWNPDNWGSPVEIGSNEITMQDVPFDVLGISDEGDTKLMKPGKNYKFKGKKVTEFPMAKNGRRQEQKGLVNLDDLTNFTNYNKQQPAGWLSKYN
jgi:hypothetical protein